MTYLQWRQDMGFRVGTTRTSPRPEAARPVSGVAMRAMQERADAAWVLSTHESEAEARVDEALVSLQLRVADAPVLRAQDGSAGGVVANQHLLDRVFASRGHGGARPAAPPRRRPRVREPHHVPRTWEGRRRNVTVTLCGDRRGSHADARRRGRRPGSRGCARRSRASASPCGPRGRAATAWRYESCFKDYGAAMRIVERIAEVVPIHVRRVARLGAARSGAGNSLPFAEAQARSPGHGHVRRGRRLRRRRVRRVAPGRSPRPRPRRRGDATTSSPAGSSPITRSTASAEPTSRTSSTSRTTTSTRTVIKLEQNYRSTQMILCAANAVIANNRGQKVKHLWTDLGEGDRSRSASSATSTPRPASSRPRSSGSSTRA